jgi:hypothetical protein
MYACQGGRRAGENDRFDQSTDPWGKKGFMRDTGNGLLFEYRIGHMVLLLYLSGRYASLFIAHAI